MNNIKLKTVTRYLSEKVTEGTQKVTENILPEVTPRVTPGNPKGNPWYPQIAEKRLPGIINIISMLSAIFPAGNPSNPKSTHTPYIIFMEDTNK